MAKHIAVYVRVSSKKQDTRSQEPDLERWAESQDHPVCWYHDKFTGKTMQRPGWAKLEADMRAGRLSAVVVWRIDRLGRTAAGLTSLFDELQRRRINLVSLKDGVDLSTAAGRLMANVIASVAQYDNEVRSERILAGQAVAKAAGKRWGGSQAGKRIKLSLDKEKVIKQMHSEGTPIARIARVVGLSRPTVYKALM